MCAHKKALCDGACVLGHHPSRWHADNHARHQQAEGTEERVALQTGDSRGVMKLYLFTVYTGY